MIKNSYSKKGILLKLDYEYPDSANIVYRGSLLGLLFIRDTYSQNKTYPFGRTNQYQQTTDYIEKDIVDRQSSLSLIDIIALMWKALHMRWIEIATSLAPLVKVQLQKRSNNDDSIALSLFKILQSRISNPKYDHENIYLGTAIRRSANRYETATVGLCKLHYHILCCLTD